jgi:hypothetical protein
MNWTLAQDAVAPVWLHREGPAPEHTLWWVVWAGAAAALVVLVTWAVTARRAYVQGRAGTLAFDRLAGRLGVSRHERDFLRRLAAASGQTTPTALLISDSGLAKASQAADEPDRALIQRLMAHRG